jgi:outer membrane lipoprotein
MNTLSCRWFEAIPADLEGAMSEKRWWKVLILIGLISWLTGCAHVISSEMRARARNDLAFSAVLANPDAYAGETIIWGGQVIDTLNVEGLTLIKVLQMPIDYTEMPEDEEMSQGRFMAQVQGYADPEVYRKGRMLTLAGTIIGKKIEPLSAMEYVYPLVEVKEIYLWKSYPGPYGPYPGPYWNWFGSPYYSWPYYRPYFLF